MPLPPTFGGWTPFTGARFGRDASPADIERWKSLGEAGQLVAGIVAGFTPEEVAAKRGWSTMELWRHELAVETYLGIQLRDRQPQPAPPRRRTRKRK